MKAVRKRLCLPMMALHAGKFGPFTFISTIKNNLKPSATHVAFLADQKGRIDYISYDKLKNAYEKELKKDPKEKAYLIDRTQKTMVEIIKNEGPMTKEDWLKRTREEMDTSVATMQRVLERLGGLLESSRNSSKKKIFWWKGE